MCFVGKDELVHFIEECEISKVWFRDLGKNRSERLERIGNNELDERKERALRKFCREKIRMEKERRKRVEKE